MGGLIFLMIVSPVYSCESEEIVCCQDGPFEILGFIVIKEFENPCCRRPCHNAGTCVSKNQANDSQVGFNLIIFFSQFLPEN